MVLGAGLGTRLKPFTNRIPKPLIPVLGVPCIEFALRTLAAAAVKEIVVNVHAHPEKMRHYLTSFSMPELDVKESNEEACLLGSAGGFRKALSFFKEQAFYSMNADVIHAAPLEILAKKHQELRAERGVVMTLVLANQSLANEQKGSYTEILVDAESALIRGFGEKKARVPFYTGTAIFEGEAFAHLNFGSPAEFVPEVLAPWIQKGKVGFIYSDALWLDVGSPELWRQAIETLARKRGSGELPKVWEAALSEADPSLGGRFELGSKKIRYEDIEYEA